MADFECYKHSLIKSLEKCLSELKEYDLQLDNEKTYRLGLSCGIQLAIETIKRGSSINLIEYALDGYYEEEEG